MKKSTACIVCGGATIGPIQHIITDALAQTWRLSKSERHQFDQRESRFCPKCKSSTRTRALAKAIMKQIPFAGVLTFAEWVEMARKHHLRIAEINSCGCLHTYLHALPDLSYSEYTRKNALIKCIRKIKGIPHEDIQSLTYKNNTFDLVIHSDVLEHVPNPHNALEECKRVLKPNGVCIFTIPIMMNRKTIQRAKMEDNKVTSLLEPSYHGTDYSKDYLVWWEFGRAFINKEKLHLNITNPNIQVYVFMTEKSNSHLRISRKK